MQNLHAWRDLTRLVRGGGESLALGQLLHESDSPSELTWLLVLLGAEKCACVTGLCLLVSHLGRQIALIAGQVRKVADAAKVGSAAAW